MKTLIVLILLFIAVPSFADVIYLNIMPSCESVEQMKEFTMALANDDITTLQEMAGSCGMVPDPILKVATFDFLSSEGVFVELLVSHGKGAVVIWSYMYNILDVDFAQ